MNVGTPVLDGGRTTRILTENAPVDCDVLEAADVAPPVYKALTNHPTGRKFMDFFAPRRRPSAEQAVPTYRALTEQPADPAEILTAPEIVEAPTDQSTEHAD